MGVGAPLFLSCEVCHTSMLRVLSWRRIDGVHEMRGHRHCLFPMRFPPLHALARSLPPMCKCGRFRMYPSYLAFPGRGASSICRGCLGTIKVFADRRMKVYYGCTGPVRVWLPGERRFT